MSVEQRRRRGSAPIVPPQGSEVDGHGRTIGELSRELNDLQYEYGVLQDMLVEAWIDAGRHGAGEAELRMIVESLPVPVLISRRADGRILFAGGKILPVLGIEDQSGTQIAEYFIAKLQ